MCACTHVCLCVCVCVVCGVCVCVRGVFVGWRGSSVVLFQCFVVCLDYVSVCWVIIIYITSNDQQEKIKTL